MSEIDESTMVEETSKSRFGLIELILIGAMHLLLYQIAPSTWDNLLTGLNSVLRVLDFTRWSKITWFLVNTAVAAFLISIRFGPEIKAKWNALKVNRSKKKTTKKLTDEEIQHQQTIEEQKEMLERMAEGRSRRMY